MELHTHFVPNQDISTWQGACWTGPFAPHSSTTEAASPPAQAQDSFPGAPLSGLRPSPPLGSHCVCVHCHSQLYQYPQLGPHITTHYVKRSHELRSGDRKLSSGSAQVRLAPEGLIQQKEPMPFLHALSTFSISAHQIFTQPGLAELRGQREGGGLEIGDEGYRLSGDMGLALPSASRGALWASTSSSGKQ